MKLFALGLITRLLGAGLIWAGDGHDHVFAKSSVIVGVILSVGGIAVLRYMLFRGLCSRRSTSRPATNTAEPCEALRASA